MMEKVLGITDVRSAKANIPDLQVYGEGDTFALLVKASSQIAGWMKSTKVANVPGGCVMQVTTQQRNPDGSYAVAEALTYVPGVHMDAEASPRRLVAIPARVTAIQSDGVRVEYGIPGRAEERFNPNLAPTGEGAVKFEGVGTGEGER